MAIRIRKIDGYIIAVCAAKSDAKEGDIYLNDDIHHALTSKFGIDFMNEGFMNEHLADNNLIALMKQEQGGLDDVETSENSLHKHIVSSSATRTIRMQQGLTQFEYTLPEDDAVMFMLILKRNKIWFADVTR